MSQPIHIEVMAPVGVTVEIDVRPREAAPPKPQVQHAHFAPGVRLIEAPRLESAPPTEGMTFRQAAEAYINAHRGSWKNGKHAEQWTITLERFAHPLIGDRSVAEIDIRAVLEVLEARIPGDADGAAGPFWSARAETARRVRGRIESILDWAKVRGHRTGENPARWKGNLDKALPAKGPRVQHHAALPYGDTAPFMAALRAREGVTPRTLEFAILTAVRTGEALGARWAEIDLANKSWVIPGERMKCGREHRVPLTDRAVELLDEMPQGRDLVFAGRNGKRLSNMSLLAVLKRMGRSDVTVHGFRSTFRDWAAETTSHPNEVVEMALAHVVANSVEAAYRRGDLFEKRRRLMDEWAAACTAGGAT